MTINPDESSSSEDDENGEGLILNNLIAYVCTINNNLIDILIIYD